MQGMEGAENEREDYRKIINRAKRVRERVAETLRRSRASYTRPPAPGGAPEESRQRPFRRKD